MSEQTEQIKQATLIRSPQLIRETFYFIAYRYPGGKVWHTSSSHTTLESAQDHLEKGWIAVHFFSVEVERFE